MRQNKYELRISILFIFRHCFMLPFSPYPILLTTLNAMLVASSERIFFNVSPFAGFFLYKFSLQEFVFFGGGELSPHLRLFLMVRPFLSTDKISFSQTSSSQNLKLSIVSVREDSLVSRVDGIPDGRPIQVKNIYKCGFKNIRICVDGPFHDSRDFKIQRRVRNENVA